MSIKFDIAVIGGGHAGIEAAQIASQFNLKIAIFTLPDISLASPPCNPAIGGVAKGQVVREVDALGGIIGILADKAGIQYRILNDSKGYAVQSTRVQIDKDLYSQEAELLISSISNITVIREGVVKVSSEDNLSFRIHTDNSSFEASKVIFTVGTFLDGKLHFGSKTRSGGRIDAKASHPLCDLLSSISGPIGPEKSGPIGPEKSGPIGPEKSGPIGPKKSGPIGPEKSGPIGPELLKAIPIMRFKTGTPPRILKKSIDFSKLSEQKSDDLTRNFHCLHGRYERFLEQVSCFITHTNESSMEVIRNNLDKSPMFNGQIKAVGIRYCPSIEDKAHRYPDRNVHHVFVEPESANGDLFYPSGLSSSLPEEIQYDFFHKIDGLENAEFSHPGYAVEYDVIDTTTLKHTLESRIFPNIYFAGQVNGTSGYEEAAGQGLVAGANAALSFLSLPPLCLNRYDSYIGVMIEDLISNVRDEPYRLFSARSENRLYLREDNTLLRMAQYRAGFFLSCPLDRHLELFAAQYQLLNKLCDSHFYNDLSSLFSKYNGPDIDGTSKRISLSEFLKQSWLKPVEVLSRELDGFMVSFDPDVIRTVAISKKYDGYIARADEVLDRIKRLDSMKIDWMALYDSKNISFECRQRIKRIKPVTFGQLKRIEGLRPATLAIVALKGE